MRLPAQSRFFVRNHCVPMKYYKNCATFRPWQSTISKRKLRRHWRKPIVNYHRVQYWAHRPYSFNVSPQSANVRHNGTPHRHSFSPLCFQTDTPDASLNSSSLSLPAFFNHLQQGDSSSTSSPQRIAVERLDPHQSNYIRMDRKYKRAMRKVNCRQLYFVMNLRKTFFSLVSICSWTAWSASKTGNRKNCETVTFKYMNWTLKWLTCDAAWKRRPARRNR